MKNVIEYISENAGLVIGNLVLGLVGLGFAVGLPALVWYCSTQQCWVK